MLPTLVYVALEIMGVMIIFLTTVVFFNWRTKKHQQKALEQLVEEISEDAKQRTTRLYTNLSKAYSLDADTTRALATQWYAAEKQFLLKFVEQQMHNGSSEFYQNFCTLQNQVLTIITPALKATQAKQPDPLASEPKQASETKSTEIAEPDAEQSVTKPTLSSETEEEPIPTAPDWGDVFD